MCKFVALRVSIACVCAAPTFAVAHGGASWDAAPSDSLLVLLPLLAGTALYIAGMRRRGSDRLTLRRAAWATRFCAGIALLVAALVWPLDAWAELSFSAHMAQHMVLIALAPPLLLLGRAGAVWLHALPRNWRPVVINMRDWPGVTGVRRLLGSLAAVSLFHGAVLWGWHAPAAFELALRHDVVHWAEHMTLLAAGILFWRALLRARGTALGSALVWMLVTVIHSGMLGALITLAPQPLYRIYIERGGVVDVLADQQLAGLIMWVPMGTIYLIGALMIAARNFREQDTRLNACQ